MSGSPNKTIAEADLAAEQSESNDARGWTVSIDVPGGSAEERVYYLRSLAQTREEAIEEFRKLHFKGEPELFDALKGRLEVRDGLWLHGLIAGWGPRVLSFSLTPVEHE